MEIATISRKQQEKDSFPNKIDENSQKLWSFFFETVNSLHVEHHFSRLFPKRNASSHVVTSMRSAIFHVLLFSVQFAGT